MDAEDTDLLEEQQRDRVRLASEEAAYWMFCCEAGLGPSDRRELLKWLRRSPENVAELLRSIHLDGRLRKFKLKSDPNATDSNVVEVAMWSDEPVEKRVKDLPPRHVMSWQVAAAVAMVTLSFLLAIMAKVIWLDRAVSTEPSEWVHQRLTDGSIMHVGPRSDLRLAFGDNRRSVELSRGEAVFEVAKDPARPFKVSTDLADVQAVGTRFGVTRHRGLVVTVSEGTVLVMLHGENAGQPMKVHAGERIKVGDDGAASNVEQVNAIRELEWVDGYVAFAGETIGEAVNEFNRRNVVQIVVDSPMIAAKPVRYERYRVDDPRSFAESLAEGSEIALVEERSGTVLRLQRE
jgi:transmembrane sensor